MRLPKTAHEVVTRFARARAKYRLRNDLIGYCRETYEMKLARSHDVLGVGVNDWRNLVPGEYMQADSRPHNSVDLLTAVLAGHSPQYKCAVPGNIAADVASRAERWISGVWRINSRRQQVDVQRELIMRVGLDGAAALRVCWDTSPANPISREIDEEGRAVSIYEDRDFPIFVEVVKVDRIFPIGRGRLGQPFDELVHHQQRHISDVLDEWSGQADTAWLEELEGKWDATGDEVLNDYLEWWGVDREGIVYHAVVFMDKWLVPPRAIGYPSIPYVIVAFKKYDKDNPTLENMPFMYGMLHASAKLEYMTSRTYRLTDMLANMPPVYEGDSPINIGGTWGKVAKVNRGEKLTFPVYPGNPPDVWKIISDLQKMESEASFSDAMFGQLSGHASGYALGQVIGADTIRTDTPRSNLELGLATAADLFFGLLRAFAPQEFIAVVGQQKDSKPAACLSGDETRALVTECVVRPKAIQDEIRRATIGAQLASIQNCPLSIYTILQDYFDVAQPEDELDRKRAEEAENHPVIKLMAISEVLRNLGSPYVAIIDQELQKTVGAQLGGGEGGAAAPPPPPGVGNLGMGLPQGVMGNPPIIPPTGNPSEQAPSMQAQMYGGPTEEVL